MRHTPLLATLLIATVAAGCGSGAAGPAQTGRAPTTPSRHDAANPGFTVTIPTGWYRAEERVGDLTDPVERLVATTYPLRRGGVDCGPLGFGGFDAAEALVVLLERGRDPQSEWTDFPARPTHFTYEAGMTSEFSACLAEKPRIPLRDHWFRLTDVGRHFHVLVVIGDNAPPAGTREAYAILEPAVRPERAAGLAVRGLTTGRASAGCRPGGPGP